MSATPDNMLGDPERLTADLQRQLSECKAERDEAHQDRAATTLACGWASRGWSRLRHRPLRGQTHGKGRAFTRLIDDDQTARDLMTTYLTDEGFAVETAASGIDGLRRARELRPAAIILDIQMPDIDGWIVLATLKGEPELADIPVVIVTIVDEQRRGIALGAAGCLTKPIDRERLVAILPRQRAAGAPGSVLVVEGDEEQRQLVRAILGAREFNQLLAKIEQALAPEAAESATQPNQPSRNQ